MQPLGAVVPSAVRMLLRQGEMSPGKLEFAWGAAVGPAVQRATTVTMREDGTVLVGADDPVWRREVRRSLPVIRERLQELLGRDAIRSVRIVGRPRARS